MRAGALKEIPLLASRTSIDNIKMSIPDNCNPIEILKGRIERKHQHLCCFFHSSMHCKNPLISPLIQLYNATAGKLVFFAADESFKPSASSPSHVFFKTDTTLVYTGFFADFGPLDIGLTSAFCQQLSGLLADAQTSNKIVAYYCSKNGHCRANSVVLLCAYMVSETDLHEVIHHTVEDFSAFCKN